MSRPPKRKPADDLRKLLLERMEACQTAEALNDRVILPFIQALEDVCGARGYVLNIYGEQANLSGQPHRGLMPPGRLIRP